MKYEVLRILQVVVCCVRTGDDEGLTLYLLTTRGSSRTREDVSGGQTRTLEQINVCLWEGLCKDPVSKSLASHVVFVDLP